MENKESEKEKSINIRIKEATIKEFDNKLQQVYNKKQHRKQSYMIKKLIQDFNEADTQILKQYIDDNITLIDTTMQQTIKEKDDCIDILMTKIKELNKTINNNKEIIKDKDATIKELTEKNNMLQQQQQTIINNALSDKDNLILELKRDKNRLNRNIKELNKDNKEITKKADAINNAFILLQQKNNKLSNHITELKNLSFFDRLFKNYPSDIDADADIIAINDNTNADE